MWFRHLDAGQCRQDVLVIDGVVRAQWLSAGYTGTGNPEWIGMTLRDVQERGNELNYNPRFGEETAREYWHDIRNA